MPVLTFLLRPRAYASPPCRGKPTTSWQVSIRSILPFENGNAGKGAQEEGKFAGCFSLHPGLHGSDFRMQHGNLGYNNILEGLREHRCLASRIALPSRIYYRLPGVEELEP